MLRVMTSQPPTHLAIVGCSPTGLPRTYRRVQPTAVMEPSRHAAYRRLTTAILSLDIGSLTADLRSARLGRTITQLAA